MPDERFKLPRSSYEELCKIIRAYGRVSKPASLDEVNALAGVGATVISANNLFLTSVGVIEGGKAKAATQKGKDLAAALEHEIPEEIRNQWSRVVQENEFLSKMRTAVQIRRSMEASSLEAHIAYSAGEPKTGQVMTGARTVIDILRAADAITEKDGQLVPGARIGTLAGGTSIGVAEEKHLEAINPVEIRTEEQVNTGVVVKIELRIEAKPSELDGLGAKLRKLLDEIQAKSDDAGIAGS